MLIRAYPTHSPPVALNSLQASPPRVMLLVKFIHAGHSIEYRVLPVGKPKSMFDGFIAHKIQIGIQADSLGFLCRILLQFLQGSRKIGGIDIG